MQFKILIKVLTSCNSSREGAWAYIELCQIIGLGTRIWLSWWKLEPNPLTFTEWQKPKTFPFMSSALL